MESIRTLLLARTHTVILDPDRVANASTRPARHGAVDRFEAELAELGYVMSLDLAMTIRRLPNQAIEELRGWIVRTLARPLGAHPPQVPLFGGLPAAPAEGYSLYARRVMSWLVTRPEQPCPWCGRRQAVGALDPCGHLVCRTCWGGGAFAGCPICHRRVSPHDPFIALARPPVPGEHVRLHGGDLRVVHLAFDLAGATRARFERVITRAAPLSREDRAELEAVIDVVGPKAASWLPARIPVKETMAIALARLWMVSPDRGAMVRATQDHLRTATDVLRVAVVLMGADPALAEPLRLRSIGRGLRRAVLAALERLPPAQVVEDMRRHGGLWKRAGERLHPFERAAARPNVALAFAALRETDLAAASFGAAVRAHAAAVPNVRITDGRIRAVPWASAVEAALRAGDARGAAGRLEARPGELLRRADHVVRVAAARQPDALADAIAAIGRALPRGAPAALLALAAHLARRGAAWPRRVFFPGGDALRAWSAPDLRPALPAAAIAAIVAAARAELVARAEALPRFPRAVLDRGLAELLAPLHEPAAPRAPIAWPRGSELALPGGASLRLLFPPGEPPPARADLELSAALFDARWRHLGTCDGPNLVAAADGVELHTGPMAAAGARHLVLVVSGRRAAAARRPALGFAGLAAAPEGGAPCEPRAAAPRGGPRDLAVIAVPLTIDLEARRLRWIDVHVEDRGALHRAGGYRAALAHLGRDFEHLAGAAARPTLWEVACVHATARANIVYVRGPGGVTAYRRRDGETSAGRLARLLAGEHDGDVAAIPAADAPTWIALLRDDLAIPPGSAGYVLDARRTGGEGLARARASELVSELAIR